MLNHSNHSFVDIPLSVLFDSHRHAIRFNAAHRYDYFNIPCAASRQTGGEFEIELIKSNEAALCARVKHIGGLAFDCDAQRFGYAVAVVGMFGRRTPQARRKQQQVIRASADHHVKRRGLISHAVRRRGTPRRDRNRRPIERQLEGVDKSLYRGKGGPS